jgi:RNA polymerase sigma factor (sigma-70 family)
LGNLPPVPWEQKGIGLTDSDRPLIRACLDGDRRAWETLIQRYHRLLYAIPLRCGLSEDDAADVFQTVCVRLLQNLEDLRDEDHLTRWLIITAKHESWRMQRQKRRHVAIGDSEETDAALEAIPSDDPLPDEAVVRMEQEQFVRLAIRELGTRCRTLLELLYQSDPPLTYVEVARKMNMTWTSIGATRVRCLQKLRKILDRMGF